LFEPRIYRKHMRRQRFKSFTVEFKETDLWIGIDKASFTHEMIDFAFEMVKKTRKQIEDYSAKDQLFLEALSPYSLQCSMPPIVEKMFRASKKAKVGPMAAVAGAFAQQVGKSIETKFNIDEIVVENGGDIYLNVKKSTVISVFAGNSPLSEKIGLKINPEYSPLGICTSSGSVGHSLSFGKADAVVIVCKDPALADAYATYFCNNVREEKDVETVLNEIGEIGEILEALIVFKERMGIRGIFPLEIL